VKRLLALTAALATAAVGLSACDGSPPAVTVNGRVITVSALNSQLALWTSDKALVASIDQSAQQNSSQGSQPQTVEGAGGKGTYSASFVNQVLGFNIESIALQQYLSRRGEVATPVEVETARAYEETNPNRTPYWDTLATPLQNLFVDFLADEGAATAAPTDLSQVQQQYSSLQSAIFSSVCVLETSTPDLDGAKAVAGSGTVTGAQVCYDQQHLEAQPANVRAAVLGLAKVGQISQPVKTPFGYEVVELKSRNSPPLDAGVAQVLTAASSPPNQVLGTILSSAKVTVNADYGTWASCGLVQPGEDPQQACSSSQQ
jgi:hypothetical protein